MLSRVLGGKTEHNKKKLPVLWLQVSKTLEDPSMQTKSSIGNKYGKKKPFGNPHFLIQETFQLFEVAESGGLLWEMLSWEKSCALFFSRGLRPLDPAQKRRIFFFKIK